MMALSVFTHYSSRELVNTRPNGRFFTPLYLITFGMPELGGYNVMNESVRTPIRGLGRTQLGDACSKK